LAHPNLIPEMGENGSAFVEQHFNRPVIAADFWVFVGGSGNAT